VQKQLYFAKITLTVSPELGHCKLQSDSASDQTADCSKHLFFLKVRRSCFPKLVKSARNSSHRLVDRHRTCQSALSKDLNY